MREIKTPEDSQSQLHNSHFILCHVYVLYASPETLPATLMDVKYWDSAKTSHV